MCGIVGKYSLNEPRPISLDLIKQMISALHHRGPDESGIYLDDQVGLGHARLSIIDLAGGSQPIHNEDQTLWIIYNGEIFNYVELRKDLIKKRHRFYTKTDTEVILHLFEEKGPGCLNDLNGQFAFAIWDSTKKELFLARDRVGIRPLFYTQQNNSFLFASEIKAIFLDNAIGRELDMSAIDEIFTFWTTLPGKTAFKNIYELPPGHYLKVTESGVKIERYWDLPFFPPEEHLDWSADRICEHIQDLLIDAIRLRLRSDVPVGCYLSGGLDSSGVTTLVVNNFDNHVKTFGIRFEESAFDEGKHQNLMVDFLGTDHADIVATNERIGFALAETLWHCEKPMLRTAPIPLFILSELVHQNGYKVVLTGEGADELFGGYNIYREAKVRNFWAKQPNSKFRGLLIGKLYPFIFNDPRMLAMQLAFFSSGLEKVNDPLFSHLIRWQNTSKIKTFLADDIRANFHSPDNFEKLLAFLPPLFSCWDYLSKAQYLEMMLFLSNYLLSSQGDRVAMAHSVEIRLPYLDYRIIDFMGRVPSQLKIRGLKEKYILKRAFKDVLPDPIVNRPKHPYRAPIGKSLFHRNVLPQIENAISDNSLKDSGIFNIEKIRKLLKKFERLNNQNEVENMALIGIVSTQLIYQQFIVNFPYKEIPQITPNLLIDRRSIISAIK